MASNGEVFPRYADKEKRREYLRAYRIANREHRRETHRQWQAANPERKAAYDRKWISANPDKVTIRTHARRARMMAVPSEPWTRDQVIDIYGRVCWICQYPLDCDFHVDHVVPLARGGWDVMPNLRPAHPTCNVRKNAKMPPAIAQMRVWFELNRHLELMEAT